MLRRTFFFLGALMLFMGLLPAAAGAGTGGVATPSPVRKIINACGPVAAGSARCFAEILAAPDGSLASSAPQGYGPADLQSAYAVPPLSGSATPTVAIVDAYDDPNVESDLATYRSTYGLPPCTSANGCFRKISQSGGANYPAGDAGWGTEISLDVDMVSAVCPLCHILLVEANSATTADLGAAVVTAASQGVAAISNSYGGPESATDLSIDPDWNHPGIAVTAATGDSGYGVEYPAASPHVIAVGGTSLSRDASARGWTETAWSGSGSGCSAYEVKPSWQADTGCRNRTIGDTAAVADPNTGVAVYDTYSSSGGAIGIGGPGGNGWMVVGGTSVASPVVASVYAVANNASTVTQTYAQSLYSNAASLNDVTSGSNCSGGLLDVLGVLLGGGPCPNNYLSNAGPGYDGPTGNGTPNGTAAF